MLVKKGIYIYDVFLWARFTSNIGLHSEILVAPSLCGCSNSGVNGLTIWNFDDQLLPKLGGFRSVQYQYGLHPSWSSCNTSTKSFLYKFDFKIDTNFVFAHDSQMQSYVSCRQFHWKPAIIGLQSYTAMGYQMVKYRRTIMIFLEAFGIHFIDKCIQRKRTQVDNN